jgi:hypothetical protein
VWVGEQYAGDQAFKGRSTDRHVISVPMAAVVEACTAGASENEGALVIQHDGDAGRLY